MGKNEKKGKIGTKWSKMQKERFKNNNFSYFWASLPTREKLIPIEGEG